MNELTNRIAEATNTTAQEVAAWINGDESWDVSAIDQKMRDHLNDGDEHPLNTLYNRDIITADEAAALSD